MDFSNTDKSVVAHPALPGGLARLALCSRALILRFASGALDRARVVRCVAVASLPWLLALFGSLARRPSLAATPPPNLCQSLFLEGRLAPAWVRSPRAQYRAAAGLCRVLRLGLGLLVRPSTASFRGLPLASFALLSSLLWLATLRRRVGPSCVAHRPDSLAPGLRVHCSGPAPQRLASLWGAAAPLST